jgi:hypothetical protein
LRLFFVFFQRERKAGAALLSLGDAVGGSSEDDEQPFMEEPPPRAEGEKGLALRAELDVKGGGHAFWVAFRLMQYNLYCRHFSRAPRGEFRK